MDSFRNCTRKCFRMCPSVLVSYSNLSFNCMSLGVEPQRLSLLFCFPFWERFEKSLLIFNSVSLVRTTKDVPTIPSRPDRASKHKGKHRSLRSNNNSNLDQNRGTAAWCLIHVYSYFIMRPPSGRASFLRGSRAISPHPFWRFNHRLPFSGFTLSGKFSASASVARPESFKSPQ